MYIVGEHLVTHVNSGEWGGEEDLCYVCSEGRPSDTCPHVEMGEERWICTMYIVGETQSHTSPAGNGEKRICVMYTVGETQSQRSQWEMGEERGVSVMYTAGNNH